MSKILMLGRLYWPHVGGVEKHVKYLCRELRKRGHEITLWTEQYESHLPLEEKVEGVRVQRIPYSTLQSKRDIWRWILDKSEEVGQFDLVHIHDVFWWYLPLRIRQMKTPTHITFHGYEGSKPPRWQAVVQRKVAEKMCRGSICIGDFMRRWYHAQPTKVLYGVANCKPQPQSKERTAVYLGRLDEDAGILTYVKAIQIIKPPIALTVFGDGPQIDTAKRLVEKHDLPVTFHGFVEEAAQKLQKGRFAFVSRYLAIVEAMQSKRLVVAVYNNRIKRDYLECHPMAKYMIITGSAEELTEKLMALTPEQEMTMLEKAYQWAQKQTWEKLADEYEDLWKQ